MSIDFPDGDALLDAAEIVFVILGTVMSIVFSPFIGALAATPLWRAQGKAEKKRQTLRREHIREISKKPRSP